MEALKELESHWQKLVAVVGLIVWLVRVEGKTMNNEKRLDHAEQQLDTLESGLAKELGEVKQALARIEGYLKAKAEEIKK
jgi:hypothetical protein